MRVAMAVALSMLALGGCKRATPDLLLGTVEWDRVALIAEAAEPVVELAVHEGETVRAGQVLLRLDNRRAAADLAMADAELARVGALLAEQRNGARGIIHLMPPDKPALKSLKHPSPTSIGKPIAASLHAEIRSQPPQGSGSLGGNPMHHCAGIGSHAPDDHGHGRFDDPGLFKGDGLLGRP